MVECYILRQKLSQQFLVIKNGTSSEAVNSKDSPNTRFYRKPVLKHRKALKVEALSLVVWPQKKESKKEVLKKNTTERNLQKTECFMQNTSRKNTR